MTPKTRLEIVPFQKWHLVWLWEEGKPAGGPATGMNIAEFEHLDGVHNWTAVVDGAPVGCGGTIEQWHRRNIAWAYLGDKARPWMLGITRAAKKLLAERKGRIEMTVRCDFEAGHRWAEALGFTIETPIMEGYGPEGESHTAYVRHN